MKNSPQSSEHGEWPDRSVGQADVHLSAGIYNEQAQLNALMKSGFTPDEAARLVYLHDNLYSNSEMQQRMANDQRLQFARWLYEQGEMQEL